MRLTLLLCGTLLIGCGAPAGTATQPAPRSADAVTDRDRAVVARFQRDTRQWNATTIDYFGAVNGDQGKLTATTNTLGAKLARTVAQLSQRPAQIQNVDLRRRLLTIGDLYRQQFEALVDVRDAQVAGNRARFDRATRLLRRLARRKTDLATKLVVRFPALG